LDEIKGIIELKGGQKSGKKKREMFRAEGSRAKAKAKRQKDSLRPFACAAN